MISRIKKFDIRIYYGYFRYYFIDLYRKSDKNHLWVMSSGISFNILICIIPFLLILLTILGIYLEKADTVQGFMHYMNSILPLPDPYKERLISQIVERITELSKNTYLTGVLGSIGLIWTMSGLYSTIREVMNRIYDVPDDKSYFFSKMKDILMVFIIFALFLISFAITSAFQILQNYSIELLGENLTLGFFQTVIPFFLTFFVSFCLFFVLYYYVPHFKYPVKVVVFSSIIAGILFEVLKYFFTLYVLNFSNFNRIYGTYAALAISLFWIYYISVVFVIGAECGQTYMCRHNLKITNTKLRKINGTEKTFKDN